MQLSILQNAISRKEEEFMAENRIGMSIDEASAYTGIGRNTMRQLIEWQKLPVLRIGRKIVIRRDALERFVALNEGRNLRNRSEVRTIE